MVQLPEWAVVIHCKGHQTSTDFIYQGDTFADIQAKLAQQLCPSHLLPLVPRDLPSPKYSSKQLQLLHKPEYIQNTQGWIFQGSKIVCPDQQVQDIVTNLHNCFHVGSMEV